MPHFLNNSNQDIGSQMWFLLINDLLRSTCLHKTFQHFMISSVRVFNQCIKLSIRKSSGSALSELDIGIRIKNSVFPEIFYGLLPFLCFFPAFQNKRTITCFCKIPSAEQTCRTASDDHRRVCQRQFS